MDNTDIERIAEQLDKYGAPRRAAQQAAALIRQLPELKAKADAYDALQKCNCGSGSTAVCPTHGFTPIR